MLETFSYVLGIILMLLGILFSIAWHELGHLIPAKKFGVRVPKYMVGFGPTLWSRKKGETEYGLKAIPLGGYISISGMLPPSKIKNPKNFWSRWANDARAAQEQSDEHFDDKRAFYRLSPGKRIVVMLGGPVMNLILGFILIFTALSVIGVNQPALTLEKIQDCVTASYLSQTCEPAAKESPAKLAGLKAGDKIVSIAGTKVANATELFAALDKLKPEPTTIVVDRDGIQTNLTITAQLEKRPTYDAQKNDFVRGADGQVVLTDKALLGIVLATQRAPLAFGQTFDEANFTLGKTFEMVGQIPQQISNIAVSTFTGSERAQNGPISIVGIGQVAGQVASDDSRTLASKVVSGLMMLGSLNFALFVFNLIPILPLDGGHVLSACYEAVKRGLFKLFAKRDPGPVDTALAVPLTTFMWFVLMAMSLIVITADIVKPIDIQ